MIKRTNGLRFVLCDYTKVGVKHSFVSGDIKDINYLITDINADYDAAEAIKDAGVNVIMLEPLSLIPTDI